MALTRKVTRTNMQVKPYSDIPTAAYASPKPVRRADPVKWNQEANELFITDTGI